MATMRKTFLEIARQVRAKQNSEAKSSSTRLESVKKYMKIAFVLCVLGGLPWGVYHISAGTTPEVAAVVTLDDAASLPAKQAAEMLYNSFKNSPDEYRQFCETLDGHGKMAADKILASISAPDWKSARVVSPKLDSARKTVFLDKEAVYVSFRVHPANGALVLLDVGRSR